MSLPSQERKIKTLTIDLSKLANTDQSSVTGFLPQAKVTTPGTGKSIYFTPFRDLFDMQSDTGAVIEKITIAKDMDSETIVSSAVTNELRINKLKVTAGLNTETPTVTQASEVAVCNVVLSNANVAILEARPMLAKETANIAGIEDGEIAVEFNDITDAGLACYLSVVTAELATATATGIVKVNIQYRQVAR